MIRSRVASYTQLSALTTAPYTFTFGDRGAYLPSLMIPSGRPASKGAAGGAGAARAAGGGPGPGSARAARGAAGAVRERDRADGLEAMAGVIPFPPRSPSPSWGRARPYAIGPPLTTIGGR